MKKKYRIFPVLILSALITGCAVQNAKFFSSVQETDDITYGYTAENPIEIKNADLGRSINSSYYYISRLRTEKGNELEIIGRASVENPNYKEPAVPLTNRYTGQKLNYGTGPLLDRWQLLADTDTIILYTNPYHKGDVKVPSGLKFEKEKKKKFDKSIPPNFSVIKANIENEQSNFFYQKLLERFEKNDTTLNKEEYRHLYYGYIFQDDYKPDLTCDCQDSLLSYYSKETLSSQDCDSIIKYASMCLEVNPFDIRQMNMLGYAYHLKGDEKKAIPWALKTQNLLGTIMSTGSGKTTNDAMYVISVSHEHEIIKSLGLFYAGQSLIKMKYDYVKVQSNPYGLKGLYFNVEKIFEYRLKNSSAQQSYYTPAVASTAY